jgi:hypothetical protein
MINATQNVKLNVIVLIVSALLSVNIPFTSAASSNSWNFGSPAGCSVAGTADATKDSICVNGQTTLTLTGYVGAIQWQSFDGSNWINETGPGSTTDNYPVILTVTTDFRAVVTEFGCPADTSNVHTVTVGVTAPVTMGATRCGYGPVTLTASGGGTFKWYDVPTGGTPLATGPSFTPTVGATTTYYCAAASQGGGSATTPMPAQTGTFSSNARGYFFTAPSDFTITGLFVPNTTGTTQNIAVIKFVPAVPPPLYATTTNDFVVLFLTQNNPATGVIPVNIPIYAGDIIGLLGTKGPGDVNSYAPSPNTTVIDGQTVTITRMGMQFPLSTTAPQQIWQEAGGSVSRVEITYEVGCESNRTPTTATVTTPPPMSISAVPPALCQGQSSTLTAVSSNPGYSYTWSPATGLSGTTGGTVTASPMAPITYTLIGDDGTCGNIDSIFISVGPASVAGTATISSDTICSGSIATLNLTGNTGNIQWQSYNGVMWVNETGPGSTSNQYIVSPPAFTQYRAVVTSGGCDPDTTVTLDLTVLTINDPVTVNDTLCGPGTATLLSNGTGNMNWFTTPTGGNSVFTGGTYNPSVSTTTTWYVEASAGANYNVGAPNLGIGTQFPLGGNDWGLQFNVTQQIVLERVYISPASTSGNITINLRASQGGPILNTMTKSVIAFSGLQPVDLGFTITPGTGYRLELATGSVPLYYNSFGAAYPYTFPGSSVTITGFVNPAFGTGNFYYFFYNWQISEGCASNRVPVTAVVHPAVAVPTISQNGTMLTSSSAVNNQWYNNGVLIPGATAQTYDMGLSGSGTYTVVVTDPATGCSAESLPVVYTGINETLASAGIMCYPNPVKDVLNIEFKNPVRGTVTISIYNKLGELVHSTTTDNSRLEIPMPYSAGTYSVEIRTNNGLYSTRVLKM